MRYEISTSNISGEFIKKGQIDQAVKFTRIIVPKLINPRKPFDHSLQQLIHISLKTFEECPHGRYSRYLRVLIQREWETSGTTEASKNVSDIPLIIYGTKKGIYRTLNSSGCHYRCEYSTNESDYERATLAVYTRFWGKDFVTLRDNKFWAFETNESPVHISMPEKSVENKIDRYGRDNIPCQTSSACFEDLSKKYKFLIAFENSNCNEYITEKLFKNALRNDMVPIVFGAPEDDYYELAPPNSYINVDSFPSLEKLASYLQWLDSNDTAYSSYFAWKKYGYMAKKSKINCRLCGILHNMLNGRLDSQQNEFDRFTDKKTLCQL